MGIKNLWNILTPYSERKPLHVLEGKKVGIDLSGWVCESQCVVDYFVQPKMYLRNLFFRTAFLLLMDINPIFVIDGEAPTLKYQVIQKRNEMQFIGARPRTESKQPQKADKGRTRFNHVLKQCRELLISMGVPCVNAIGEAEALCAWLNKDGLIDGVISQDSDCFGYGAVTVYRNFSVSKQGNQATQGGAIDVYDMKKVWESIDLKQHKAVMLGLLCGCDYAPNGIEGIGKEAVLKLFSMYKSEEILSKMKEWKTKQDNYTELELKVDDKSYCSGCGHYGTLQKHAKSGCPYCKTGKGCDTSTWKEKRLMIKAELLIRKKYLQSDTSLFPEIIDEFLQEPKIPENICTDLQQPNVVKFVKSLSKHLQWPEIYCFQKILSILTRWQLKALCMNRNAIFDKGSVQPVKILKKRILKGVDSFEILWEDADKCFDAIFSREELNAYELEHPNEGIESLWCTIEPKVLIEKAYPELVEEFLKSTLTKKKSSKTTKNKKQNTTDESTPRIKKKSKTKHNSSLQDMSGLLEAIEDIENQKKKTRKPRQLKNTKGMQCITKFLKSQVQAQSTPTRLNKPKIQENTDPNANPIGLEIPSDFSDCSIEESYSSVINNIVTQAVDVTKLGDKTLFFEEKKQKTVELNKYLLDDSVLLRVKRKSFKPDLSIYQNSFDDFLVNIHSDNYYQMSEVGLENGNEALKSPIQNDKSYFFDVISDLKEDVFEQTLGSLVYNGSAIDMVLIDD